MDHALHPGIGQDGEAAIGELDRLVDLVQIVGQQFGPEGPGRAVDEPRYETPSFRRSNAHAVVGEEVRAVRTGVGINEIHNFGKYELTGPSAKAFLERVMANAPPPPGKIRLTPMLSRRGKLIGDFTMACVAEGRYRLTASYAAQAFHMRWFAIVRTASSIALL